MGAKLEVTVGFGNYQIPSTLVVISADEKNYRATVLFGFSRFVDILERTSLSETDLPSIALISSAFQDLPLSEIPDNFDAMNLYLFNVCVKLAELNDASYPENIVCFPHFQRAGSSLTDYRHHNRTEFDLDSELVAIESATTTLFGGISPAFFLMNILKLALQQQDLELKGNFLLEPFIDRLLTFGTKEIPHTRGVVNFTDGAGFVGPYIKFEDSFEPKDCLSEISLMDIIKKLKSHFTIPLYVDFNKNEVVMDTWDSVFANPEIVDWTDKFEKWIEIKDGKIDGQDFGYSIESDAWAEKSIVTIAEYNYKGTKNNYAELEAITAPQPKDIWFVKSLGMYYRAEFDDAGMVTAFPNYVPVSHNAFGRYNGDGGLKRSFILPTLDDNGNPLEYGYEGDPYLGKTLDLFEYKSNRPFQKPLLEYTSIDNREFRISFWMGKVYGLADFLTPFYYMASSVGEPMPYNGNYLTFSLPKPDFSLWIDSEEGRPYVVDKPGVAARFGGRFFDLMSRTKKLRGKFRLTESDLIELKPTAKIRVGNNLYFYDQIRGSLPISKTFDVDMYWIPPGITVPETIESDGPTLGNGAGKGGTASAGGSGGSSGGGGGGGTGADGKTILNGTGVPDPELGTDEDFYLDTATYIFYGPKTAGAWGSGVSLVGPTGNGISSYSYNAGTGVLTITNTDATSYSTGDLRGPSGAPGPIGPNGPTGETGAEGENNTNHIFNFLNFA
jgi:uncharacterized membrane protein YgcG